MVDFSGEIKITNPKSLEQDETTKSFRTRVSKRRTPTSMSVMSNDGTYHKSRTTASTVGGSGRSQLSQTNRELEQHDKKSKKVVKRLKTAILLFFTMTAAGVATAFFVYRSYNTRAREAAFKKKFRDEAYNMLASIGANMDLTLGATDAFAISMIAEADATNQTYPFVTINNFAVQAGKLLKNSRAKYITTYNAVAKDQRREWEDYARNHNSWIDQSIEVQSRDPGYSGPEITEEFLTENYLGNYDLIHDYDEAIFGWENSTDGVDHDGPFLPIWQCTPVIPIDPIYNWDLLSNSPNLESAVSAMESHLVTISETYLINWPDDKEWEEYNEAESEWFSNYLEPGEDPMSPIFDIYYPVVVESLRNVIHREPGYNVSENNMGAYLALSIYWRDMLRDLLPTGSTGVIAVFKNPWNPPFAFEIAGPAPRFLGVGYYNATMMGDPDLNITTGLKGVWDYAVANTSYTGIPVNEKLNPYTIEVYPAESAREHFMQNNDNTVYVVLILVLVVSIMTIAFTFLFFFLYDRLVRNEIRAKINLLDAKRKFVRFVSHEVRTPLNTVTMGLTLILQEFNNREKRLKKRNDAGADGDGERDEDRVTAEDFARWSSLTEEVSNNAGVAVGVLNDLLNIDKIQMGAFKLEMDVLPIWRIVEQTTAEFKMMATKQKTDLRLDLSTLAESEDVESAITHSSMLPSKVLERKLVGDEQRLQQVLRNLLSNALKFSKSGSVTVKVSLRDPTTAGTIAKDVGKAKINKEFRMADGSRKSFAACGRIVVDVVDTGVGMTPAQLQTVFDLGTQFNANKLQSGGGSGLGLAFAKAIAEQHGGSLRAFSDGAGKGTTFRLDLPLHLDAPKDGSVTASSGRKVALDSENPDKSSRSGSSGEVDELEPMSILVVDDAPMNRKLLVRLLEMNGHTCAQAENGQDLINAVKENMVRYDCILVDYEMPVMNGPEACKGVREMGYTGFVVGVTGNLLPEDVGYFMDCGADAVLPKPFMYKELEELLIEHGMFGLS